MARVGEEKRKERPVGIIDLLDTLARHIPSLVKNIMDIVISEDAGRRLGEAVGAFYKELREAGIAPEEALRMARAYMESLVKFDRLLSNLGLRPLKLAREERKEGEKEQEES
ncbi:hypothetical protein DRO33_01160 [Candidatus Bathyarchaeota archaeon]|nr:MAG: hypothetical protein DRO33_01160 [Candidatus Bathyarchaeota archaeon]